MILHCAFMGSGYCVCLYLQNTKTLTLRSTKWGFFPFFSFLTTPVQDTSFLSHNSERDKTKDHLLLSSHACLLLFCFSYTLRFFKSHSLIEVHNKIFITHRSITTKQPHHHHIHMYVPQNIVEGPISSRPCTYAFSLFFPSFLFFSFFLFFFLLTLFTVIEPHHWRIL